MDKKNHSGSSSPDERTKKLKKQAKREAKALWIVEEAQRELQKAEQKLARAARLVQERQAVLQEGEAVLETIRAIQRTLESPESAQTTAEGEMYLDELVEVAIVVEEEAEEAVLTELAEEIAAEEGVEEEALRTLADAIASENDASVEGVTQEDVEEAIAVEELREFVEEIVEEELAEDMTHALAQELVAEQLAEEVASANVQERAEAEEEIGEIMRELVEEEAEGEPFDTNGTVDLDEFDVASEDFSSDDANATRDLVEPDEGLAGADEAVSSEAQETIAVETNEGPPAKRASARRARTGIALRSNATGEGAETNGDIPAKQASTRRVRTDALGINETPSATTRRRPSSSRTKTGETDGENGA